MDYRDAAVAVLRDEDGGPLHWTVIQDLALKRGYIDPFTQQDLRKNLLAALAEASREGVIAKADKGVYTLPREVDPDPS